MIQTGENITFARYIQEKIMSHNLARLPQEEKDKINVDLA
ncbi:DNA polymerase III subunit theta, partial [Pantoea graminicola]